MPRKAREKSLSNIYHVILRGINRQIIFENDGDRHYFMTVLRNCKDISGFRLHAFCLMSNHIHLLIEPGEEPLEIVFKRIGSRYVGWYNRKYQRAGHLFQDRFRSENVETEQYFVTVLRYILQNPMKAGMENSPGSYRWSSYLAYEQGGGSLTDTAFAESLFGSREELIDFVKQANDDMVMDEKKLDWRLKDDDAREMMIGISQCETASDFQQLNQSVRREFIREMYRKRLSISQISRLTGVSKSVVYKAVQEVKQRPVIESLPLHEDESTYAEIW